MSNASQSPNKTKEMIRVGMSDKHPPQTYPIKLRILKLSQNTTTAAAIYEEIFISIIQNKAGVVILCDNCRTGTEGYKFVQLFYFFDNSIPGGFGPREKFILIYRLLL
jgi:hypothetical protein